VRETIASGQGGLDYHGPLNQRKVMAFRMDGRGRLVLSVLLIKVLLIVVELLYLLIMRVPRLRERILLLLDSFQCLEECLHLAFEVVFVYAFRSQGLQYVLVVGLQLVFICNFVLMVVLPKGQPVLRGCPLRIERPELFQEGPLLIHELAVGLRKSLLFLHQVLVLLIEEFLLLARWNTSRGPCIHSGRFHGP